MGRYSPCINVAANATGVCVCCGIAGMRAAEAGAGSRAAEAAGGGVRGDAGGVGRGSSGPGSCGRTRRSGRRWCWCGGWRSSPGQYPWEWQPAEAEAFVSHLRSGARPVTVSTAHEYEAALRMFCEYVTDPRYEWPEVCGQRFGQHRSTPKILKGRQCKE